MKRTTTEIFIEVEESVAVQMNGNAAKKETELDNFTTSVRLVRSAGSQ